MKLTRALAFFTALGLLAGCAGCGGAPEQSPSPPPSDTVSAASVATPSWKTDTSDHTAKWFLSYDWYGKKFNPEGNTYDQWLKQETGCTLEIQTGDFDKLNVLIQTNSLPDIITTDATASQRLTLENSGRLLALDELKKQYAPDLHVPESEVKWYTAPDGKWYSIVNFYYGDDNVAENHGYMETHNQNFVRTDVLKQFGMTTDDMRTKDGFLKALRQVKENNVEYNGIKMIPYAVLIGEGALEHIAYQFGASQEAEDGSFVSLYRTPEYLEALKFYNQLYNEGLMTDESFTMKKDQIQQKVASGQLFCTTVWSNVNPPRDSLYAADHNATMLYCGGIQGDLHDRVAVPAQANAGWAATMISKGADRPDRIIQLFSFLSQKETVLNHEWSVGGWTLDANGIAVLNEERQAEKNADPAAFNAKYAGDLPWLTDYTFAQGATPLATTVLGKDGEARVRDGKVTIYDDKCFSIAMEMGSEIASIETRVSEYKNQEIARIITADPADVDRMYETMLREMENMGLAKVEAYQNEAFQNNKKQLGVAFVHPFHQ